MSRVTDNTAPIVRLYNWPGKYTNDGISTRIYASDNSGVLAIGYRYKIGNNDWTDWNWFTSDSIDIQKGDEGEKPTLQVRAIDLFANVAEQTYKTTFDFTPPECHIKKIDGDVIGFNPLDLTPGPFGPEPTRIYGCPVTVDFEAEDDISPVHVYYRIDEEGDWQMGDARILCELHNPSLHQFEIDYYAEDETGNRGETKTVKLWVNTTPDIEELLEWLEWNEKIGDLLTVEALREGALNFYLMEEAFVGKPSKVKVDFRGPIIAKNKNPTWQSIGEATRVTKRGKVFWQAPKWNTRDLSEWSEIFDVTISQNLAPQDVKFKAYICSKEVGCLKSEPVTFSILPSNIKVNGKVLDVFGMPVRAKVSLDKREAMTDEKGNYLFEDIPPGKYLLSVTPLDKGLHQVKPKGSVEIISKGKDITQNFLFAVTDKVAPWISSAISWDDLVESGLLIGFTADNP
ncbi:MAG TPA: carboxypeptidase regulatory-like domain-containing protein, partial [Archaeoglobus sp.]|nr:carboxypeptidase regulatory-like domain-containing protein [Archaeoglobus sp.]